MSVDADAGHATLQTGQQVTGLAQFLAAHRATRTARALCGPLDIRLDHFCNAFARVNDVDDGAWSKGFEVLDECAGVASVCCRAVDTLR